MLRRRVMMAQSGSGSGGGETEVPNGVYIQDTTGRLWDAYEWDGSATPNGVAVVADEYSVVIALQDLEGSYLNHLSTNLPLYDTIGEASLDFNGRSNTEESNVGEDGINAPDSALFFTFPNGQNGYLGAAGEWCKMEKYSGRINLCLSKVGITLDVFGLWWTSTRNRQYYNWAKRSNYNLEKQHRDSALTVRPFTELGEVVGVVLPSIPEPPVEFPLYIEADYCEEADFLLGSYCYSNSLGQEFYTSLKTYLRAMLLMHAEESPNGTYYLENPLDYGIEIFVKTGSSWAQIVSIDLYDENVTGFYDGSAMDTSISFDNDEIRWGS